MITVSIVDIECNIDECIGLTCQNMVPEWKQASYERMRHDDRLRSGLGYGLLRLAAFELWGKRVDIPSIQRMANGKPFLGIGETLRFNISHSGRWVVVAISNHDIGIDIEAWKAIEYMEISESFFHEDEHYALSAEHGEKVEAEFYNIWTAKESFVKLTGEGLRRSFESFRYVDHGRIIENGAILATCSHLQIARGYSCCIASNAPDRIVVCEPVTASRLMQFQ